MTDDLIHVTGYFEDHFGATHEVNETFDGFGPLAAFCRVYDPVRLTRVEIDGSVYTSDEDGDIVEVWA